MEFQIFILPFELHAIKEVVIFQLCKVNLGKSIYSPVIFIVNNSVVVECSHKSFIITKHIKENNFFFHFTYFLLSFSS